MQSLAGRLSTGTTEQAVDSNLFVDGRAGRGTGVMSLEGGRHTGVHLCCDGSNVNNLEL